MMITLKRSDLYRFARVANKMFGTRKPAHAFVVPNDSVTFLVLSNDNNVFRMKIDPQAVDAPFPIPWELIRRVEKDNDTPVYFLMNDGSVTAQYFVLGKEKTSTANLQKDCQFEKLPQLPEKMGHVSSDFFDRMQYCSECTDPNSGRYSLGHVALNGENGTMTATDGSHAMEFENYDFPWKEVILLFPSKIFSMKEFCGSEIVSLGNKDSWLTIQTGNFMFQFKNYEGRFPKVDHVFSSQSSVSTWADLDEKDCAFVSATLNSLPCSNEVNSPVTLELGDQVILRATDKNHDNVTELVLSHSSYSGKATRLAMNRDYLERALRMGHRRIGVYCGDKFHQFFASGIPDSRYIWMEISDAAVPRTEKTKTIYSTTFVPTVTPTASPQPQPMIKETPKLMNTSPQTTATRPAATATKFDEATREPVTLTLLQNAERLEKSLREALTATQQIIRQSKVQAKRNHALKSAMASLGQLQKLDIAT